LKIIFLQNYVQISINRLPTSSPCLKIALNSAIFVFTLKCINHIITLMFSHKMRYSQTGCIHTHMWTETKAARNHLSLSIILSHQSSYKSLWNSAILQKKDKQRICKCRNAIEKAKNDHLSVRKTANACNINFMIFQR